MGRTGMTERRGYIGIARLPRRNITLATRVGLPYLVVAPPTAHPATDQDPLGTRLDASKAEKSDQLSFRAVTDWLTNATPNTCLKAVPPVLISEAARGVPAAARADNRHRRQTHTAAAPERAVPHQESSARARKCPCSPSAAARLTSRLRQPATAGAKHAVALSPEERPERAHAAACKPKSCTPLKASPSTQNRQGKKKKKRENKV
ncbi:hypothetical protein NDU88_002215 [Pleurodeles waltl]|uniref:Uncharacterized protein n=1 Tax=Pleurodeles waltl TaxID=8319 RepID=A0AAV7M1I4_PLEWA|nr:hypothetical protein NDU88_002215 [Pleurodeles waltl]